MINDQEQYIYDLISNEIKSKYENAVLFHQKLVTVQNTYPAISIIMIDNSFKNDYSTFDYQQTVSYEKYKFEVAHNESLTIVKDILDLIEQKMNALGYVRIRIGIDENQETNDIRRISEYEKLIMK